MYYSKKTSAKRKPKNSQKRYGKKNARKKKR